MIPTIPLADGGRMPQLGLGVYLVSDVVACETSVTTALEAGCRLVDTAVLYRNERAVGRGIRASGVPRDEVFVTTKLWPSQFRYDKAGPAIDSCLERLGTGHIDLLLLHQPVGDVPGAWRAMEEAVDAGKVRSIGVSNFTVNDLEALLPAARIAPVVDQVELHPYWQQPDLLPYLSRHGIAVEAWYPLAHGAPKLLVEPVIAAAASVHDKSPAQIVLRWHIQRGFIVIPKSTNPDHITANLDVFDFALTDAEMAGIDALGTDRPMMRVPRWAMAFGKSLMPLRPLP